MKMVCLSSPLDRCADKPQLRLKKSMQRIFPRIAVIVIGLLTAAIALCFTRQEEYTSYLHQLVLTEQQFAQTAGQTTLKEAFESYLHPQGILFTGGQPVNGVVQYHKLPRDKTGSLRWYPVYARITAAGDMGFTTGPFWYTQHGSNGSTTGYFFSIWEKNQQQAFRLKLDGGVVHTIKDHSALLLEKKIYGDEKQTRAFPLYTPAKDPTPEKAFQQLCKMAKEQPGRAYRQHLSAAPLMVRPNWPLIRDPAAARNYFSVEFINYCDFELLGQGASVSHEMIYYYGRMQLRHALNGPPEKGYFIQVWRQEPYGWKVVADVYQPDK